MIGTAGAYGYRNYHSNSAPSAAPVDRRRQDADQVSYRRLTRKGPR